MNYHKVNISLEPLTTSGNITWPELWTECCLLVIYMSKSHPSMWWYEEVGPLEDNEIMRVEPACMGLVSLWKRPQRALLPCPQCEDIAGRQPPVYQYGDTKSAGALTLDLPASRIVRNICLLFKPPSPW